MNYKELLNSAAKWGLCLGVVMAASRVFETKIITSATMSNLTYLTFEWMLVSAIYVVVIFRANKMRSAIAPAEVGYSFSQSINYSVLISIFAAVIVGLASHIYIVNYIGGYDVYAERSISSIMMVLGEDGASEDVAKLLDASVASVETIRDNPPSLVSTIFSTISTYILSAFVVGLGVAAMTRKKPMNGSIREEEQSNE